jgi:GT2 family glycosyltransferase
MTMDCVRALQAMSSADFDILVIDNGSGEESVAKLRHCQDGFELRELSENVGFAAGNNYGLREALARGYEYALLVNNDAFVAPDLLEKMLAEAEPDIGLLSPKIMYESEPERIWFAGGRRHPLTIDLLDARQGQLDKPGYASQDVDYLLGTCLLVNLQAARAVGLLDERYYFYFEDLDWSLRFTEAGYRLRLVEAARLYHRIAVSTGGNDDTAQRRYYLARGGVLFWRDNAHFGSPGIIFVFRTLSAVKMVVRLTVTGRWPVAQAYLRGLRDGWRISSGGRSKPAS